MGYRCKSCKKEFPIAAWIETNVSGMHAVPGTMASTMPPSTKKTPCCPFCSSLEIEEVRFLDGLMLWDCEKCHNAVKVVAMYLDRRKHYIQIRLELECVHGTITFNVEYD